MISELAAYVEKVGFDSFWMPDDILEKAPVFFGTEDDVIGGIEKYVRAGARHFVVNFYVRPEMLKDNLKLFAEEVIPYFRQN